jgi:hypothetical protein
MKLLLAILTLTFSLTAMAEAVPEDESSEPYTPVVIKVSEEEQKKIDARKLATSPFTTGKIKTIKKEKVYPAFDPINQ